MLTGFKVTAKPSRVNDRIRVRSAQIRPASNGGAPASGGAQTSKEATARRSDVLVEGGAEAVLAETVNHDYFPAGLYYCVSILAPSSLGRQPRRSMSRRPNGSDPAGTDRGEHRLACLRVESVRRVEGKAVDDVAEASTNLCAHLLRLAHNGKSVQHGVVDE